MSKHRYHSVEFQAVDWAAVTAEVAGGRVAFNVDVAKPALTHVLNGAGKS